MDWLSFIEKIVASLAWPLATLTMILLLKNEIAEVLPKLTKFKAGPLEAEFEKEVRELKRTATAQKTEYAINEPQAPYSAFRAEVTRLAEIKPSAAILEAWIQIENAARNALKSQSTSVGSSSYIPASRLSTPLLEQKILSATEAETFDKIRKLRNEVAHAQGFAPTRESAQEFAEVAETLFMRISSHVHDKNLNTSHSLGKNRELNM